MGALEVLAAVGVEVAPPCVILIYGLPMIGKSAFAACLARELAESGDGKVVVLATEPSYGEQEYVKMIGGYLGKVKYDVFAVDSANKLFRSLIEVKKMRDRVACLVIDSISAIADQLAAYVMASMHTTEPRIIASRVSPMLRAITYEARDVSLKQRCPVIIVAHATSTAGTGKFRGVVEWKPSLAVRCAHYISYMLYMEMDEHDRIKRYITVTAARTKPWIEGRRVAFRFTSTGVEKIDEGRKK